MKSLLSIAIVAVFTMANASPSQAQGVQFQVSQRGLNYGNPSHSNRGSYSSYHNRLNRYWNNNNYGYGNQNWNRGGNNYGNYDYYGRNRGRVQDYRNYYRSNPSSGYNRWYNSGSGFSIGNGRAGFYYSF